MTLKCCVPLCNSNYETSTEKTSIYKLPKKPQEQDEWVKAIPRSNIKVSKYTAVCRKHWPDDCLMQKVYGKWRPVNPPSIFPGIPSSCLMSPPAKRRKVESITAEARNSLPDELEEFVKLDKLEFDKIPEKLEQDKSLIIFKVESSYVIQSKEFDQGFPIYLLKVNEDLSFTAMHYGHNCRVTSLTASKISKCENWSTFEEIIRYLQHKEKTHKDEIITQHLSTMEKASIGEKLYTPDIITRAFEYFCISRTLYSRMVQDYQLPSIRTLSRITARTRGIDDVDFSKRVMENLPQWQRRCVILWDEVYIKSSLKYSGGSLFGKAVDHPEKLAKTVLAIMQKHLYGGPEFICKALPVSNLTSAFLVKESKPFLDSIVNNMGQVIAIIADGHQTNQKCFKLLNTIKDKPWLKDENTFLLYDYVHVLKCLRNNWLTEKSGELEYEFNGTKGKAKWSDLKDLYEAEAKSLIKLSRLDEVSVSPKPIERQKVSTCLKVFCDETVSALETHPCMTSKDVSGTVNFIKIFNRFWKILNVKGPGADIRFKDPDRAVIQSMNDPRFDFLKQVAVMSKQMSKKGKVRQKSLTTETSKFLSHICYGFIDLAKYLLSKGNQYVIFGWFTTDPLEKYFSKLRQGSGGTYFINAQSVIEKINIHHAKLAMQLNLNIDDNLCEKCESCVRCLEEDECEVIDNLVILEESVTRETVMGLVYVTGYIQRKWKTEIDDTFFYYDNYGSYLSNLNRGGLIIPHDSLVQWSIYCFILFHNFKGSVCRSFLTTTFLYVAEKYNFFIHERQSRILANIFLNNYSKLMTPRSSKEVKQKIAKLS